MATRPKGLRSHHTGNERNLGCSNARHRCILAGLGTGFGDQYPGRKAGAMFVRVTRFHSAPDRIDGVVENFQRTAMSGFGPLKGFIGGAVLVDRGTGAGHAVTYWDSAESMQASEETGVSLRSEAAQELEGLRIGEVDHFEILVEERAAPPRAGAFVRVNDVQGSHSKADEVARMIRERSDLKSLPGFRSVIMGANRETGRMVISTSWDTAEDRDASDSAVRQLRQDGAAVAGAPIVNVELYEAAFIDVKQAAPV
jgi:heme-degrading monooxygenase HmoA